MTGVFFFEIRPIEELQDPEISPRREEVGRRTLGAIGGFLLTTLSFYCLYVVLLLSEKF